MYFTVNLFDPNSDRNKLWIDHRDVVKHCTSFYSLDVEYNKPVVLVNDPDNLTKYEVQFHHKFDKTKSRLFMINVVEYSFIQVYTNVELEYMESFIHNLMNWKFDSASVYISEDATDEQTNKANEILEKLSKKYNIEY